MIMPLEKQVCNKELSLRLRSLGVPQLSNYAWRIDDAPTGSFLDEVKLFATLGREDIDGAVSTFTVAELGEMLPMEYMSIKDGGDRWFGVKQGALWEFEMIKYPDPIVSNLEADCRAKILIYLLENKLITL